MRARTDRRKGKGFSLGDVVRVRTCVCRPSVFWAFCAVVLQCTSSMNRTFIITVIAYIVVALACDSVSAACTPYTSWYACVYVGDVEAGCEGMVVCLMYAGLSRS